MYLDCWYLSVQRPVFSLHFMRLTRFFLVMIIVIAVGIQDRPASAPLTDTPWVSDYQIIAHPSFTQGIAAVSKIVFALSGTPGFFAIVSEMRDPRKYTQAVLICQITVAAVFMTIGCVVYYYCGSYVASPALGSAGGIIKKISYGFAMPGLIVTTTICTHVTKHSSSQFLATITLN